MYQLRSINLNKIHDCRENRVGVRGGGGGWRWRGIWLSLFRRVKEKNSGGSTSKKFYGQHICQSYFVFNHRFLFQFNLFFTLGHDLRLRRFERMTVHDIYKQNTSMKGYFQLCSCSIYSIIQFSHPNVTTIDIVRTWALVPSQITVLKIASPSDMAVAFEWDVKNTCKSKTFQSFLDIARLGSYIGVNNDTLKKFGKRLNLTVDEMAFLLRRTVASLLLMPNIKFKKLQREINQGKLVEQKVSRLIQLVAFLKTIQPGARFNEHKLKEIIRNYSYEIAKNLTDDSLKQIISTNHIDVFTKYVQLKNLGVFFGNLSLDNLKELRLSDIIVDLMGMDINDFESQFSSDDVKNKIREVEMYWGIRTELLTLEKLLIASKLMEGNVQFVSLLHAGL